MKKTYFSPVTKVTKIQLSNMLLNLSTSENSAVITDGKVNLQSREDNGAWDIWGNGDYEED